MHARLALFASQPCLHAWAERTQHSSGRTSVSSRFDTAVAMLHHTKAEALVQLIQPQPVMPDTTLGWIESKVSHFEKVACVPFTNLD